VLTAINSCGPVLHTILLNVVISDIQQKSLLSLLEVFPNPSNGNVNIKYDTANDFYLTLYNVIGEIIFKKKYSVNSLISTIPLDFSGLSNGIYQLEIDDGKELSRTSLIISK
jgi:hypothetical protein